MYTKYFKRLLDFVIAFILLILTFPVNLIVTLVLVFSNNGKAFFVQPRPGKNGKIFYIIKYMTMNDQKDNNGVLLPDNERITKTGRFIRKSSLDELPQLVNVLKGDLSLIGPRPLLVDYLPLYNDIQRRRHEVRPGITGWAQINGRNSISWDEKFILDIWYVDHLSFILDIKILLGTVLKIFKTGDINSSKSTTMEKFTGSCN